MRVVLVSPSRSSNSLGRTYVHWELCRRAGFEVLTIAADREPVWPPLQASDFGLSVLSVDELVAVRAFRPDLVVCVKPLAESMGLARRIVQGSATPVVVDIDDPDLSAALAVGSPVRALAKWVLRTGSMRAVSERRRLAEAGGVLVSNPTLQRIHGGEVIPHARDAGPPGREHTSTAPVVAFIGTNRDHKGVPELRRIVARLHAEAGFTLVVTDDPPADAKEWERWVGQTSFDEGMALLRRADIVALPSRRVPFARGQLPAKLIDAMFAGRAIIVSDVAPLPWALGDAGLVFRAGRSRELYECMKKLADPRIRQRYGDRARERAIARFSFDALLPSYVEVLLSALPTSAAMLDSSSDPKPEAGA